MATTETKRSARERCRDYEARRGRGSDVNRECIKVSHADTAASLSSLLSHRK
jgi:hypothetical protein